jgi:hypothetical protein
LLSEDFGYIRGVGPRQTITLPYNQVSSICGVVRQRRVIDTAIFSDNRYGRDLEIRFDLGPGDTNSLAINFGAVLPGSTDSETRASFGPISASVAASIRCPKISYASSFPSPRKAFA